MAVRYWLRGTAPITRGAARNIELALWNHQYRQTMQREGVAECPWLACAEEAFDPQTATELIELKAVLKEHREACSICEARDRAAVAAVPTPPRLRGAVLFNELRQYRFLPRILVHTLAGAGFVVVFAIARMWVAAPFLAWMSFDEPIRLNQTLRVLGVAVIAGAAGGLIDGAVSSLFGTSASRLRHLSLVAGVATYLAALMYLAPELMGPLSTASALVIALLSPFFAWGLYLGLKPDDPEWKSKIAERC